MLATLAQTVLPALVLIVTLFGLLARGNPRPGGVALFGRVGAVTLLLGGALYFVVERTALAAHLPTAISRFVAPAYTGFVAGGILLLLLAALGSALKRQR
jgi:hypothetical protein